MKKHIFFLFSAMTLLATAPAFAHRKEIIVVQAEQPDPYFLVESEPPAEQVEVIPASPGPNYYWVKGRWKWDNRWSWTNGSWVVRPSAHSTWVPGYWIKHHHRHGWYWVEGHWQ